MPNIFLNILIFVLSLLGVLKGSDMVVDTVDNFSRKIKTPSFIISFFLLGFLTSLPEISIAINAINQDQIDVTAGNLFGGVIIIFLFLIPVLGILGNGLKLKSEFESKHILYVLLLILAPIFLSIDQVVHLHEGLFIILLYLILLYSMRHHKVAHRTIDSDHKNEEEKTIDMDNIKQVVTIVVGIVLLLVSSNFLVYETEILAAKLNISDFAISLIVLSLGTNLPEMSLAYTSIKKKKKDVALGNYMGSAVTNSAIFAIVTIITGGFTLSTQPYIVFYFMLIGISLFYLFARSKGKFTRGESLILLITYFIFVIFELFLRF